MDIAASKSLVHSCSYKRGPLTRALGFSGETWPLPSKKGVRGNNQSTNLSPLTHQTLLSTLGQIQVEVRGEESKRDKVWWSSASKDS